MHSQIQDFLQWAERDRLRSPATIKRYQTVLAQIPDPLNATVEDIEAWWSGRYDKSAATRQNELACLRTFYKWATRFDHRVDDLIVAEHDPERHARPLDTKSWYKIGLDAGVAGGLQWCQQRKHNGRNPR